jgi:hypothetical protein
MEQLQRGSDNTRRLAKTRLGRLREARLWFQKSQAIYKVCRDAGKTHRQILRPT